MTSMLEPPVDGVRKSIASRVLRELNHGSVGWAVGLAVTVALALNPFFGIAFPVLLGRTLFVALVLVLVFHGVGLWRQALMPRWLAQTIAVALAAPIATALVYLVATSGNVASFVGNPYRVTGFLWIAGCALGVGLIVALGALVRERDAQAHSQALQFEIERGQLERQALDARLAVLTAQIEPHFLFNTLANVQALVDTRLAACRAGAEKPDRLPARRDAAAAGAGRPTLRRRDRAGARLPRPDAHAHARSARVAIDVDAGGAGPALSADGAADAGGKRRAPRHRPERGGRAHRGRRRARCRDGRVHAVGGRHRRGPAQRAMASASAWRTRASACAACSAPTPAASCRRHAPRGVRAELSFPAAERMTTTRRPH